MNISRLKNILKDIAIEDALVLVLSVFLIVFSVHVYATGSLTASDEIGQLVPHLDSATLEFKLGIVNTGMVTTSDIGLSNPNSVAIDHNHHRMYVADQGNARVLEFDLDSSDIPLDGIADHVLGQPDFNSRVSFTSQTNFKGPTAVAYDDMHDRLFVSDTDGNRVLVFDGTNISDYMPAIDVLGQSDFNSNGANSGAGRMSGPHGISFNHLDGAHDYIYIADTGNNRVLVFDGNNLTTNSNSAIAVIGQADFDAATAGTDRQTLSSPFDVSYDSTHSLLYVADDVNNRIMVFDVRATDNTPEDACDFADSGVTTTGLTNPGGLMNAYCELGQADFSQNGSDVSATAFNHPIGINYDNANNRIFVSDSQNNRIMIFDGNGLALDMSAANVLGQSNFNSSDGHTDEAYLLRPFGLYFNSNNNRLYVADSNNNRVEFFNLNNPISNGEAATFEVGEYDLVFSFGAQTYTQNYANSTNYIKPTEVGFYFNGGTGESAIDTVGHRLFVADHANNRVLVYNLDSNNQLTDYQADYVLGQQIFNNYYAGSWKDQMNAPDSVIYDPDNQRLFVGEYGNFRVLVFDVRDTDHSPKTLCAGGSTTTGLDTGMEASCLIGQADYTTHSNTPAQDVLSNVYQMAYDKAGKRLFVGDGAARVMVFNVDPSTMTNSEMAINMLGHTDYSAIAPEDISTPSGLAYDADRHYLYVADADFAKVSTYDVTSITNGQAAVHHLASGTPGTSATNLSGDYMNLQYDAPAKLLYLTDRGNNRVLEYNLASISDGQGAVAVIGQDSFSTHTSNTSQTELYAPLGLGFDATSRKLYVGDNGNNRLMIFNLLALPALTLPDAAKTYPYTQSLNTQNSQGTVSFNLISGALPPGLSLDSSGISGTPTTIGTYNFTLQAVDTLGVSTFYSNIQSYTLLVAEPVGGGGGGITTCQDHSATNFGGALPCQYAVLGCTNYSATNYNPLATQDDGSCILPPPPVLGCMNPLASNYNPQANQDNGSCIIPPPPCPTCNSNGNGGNGGNGGGSSGGSGGGTGGGPILPPPPHGNGGSVPPPPVYTPPTPPVNNGGIINDIKNIFNSPNGDVISKVIAAVGLALGALGTVGVLLFATPFSLSELVLLPARLWSLLLVAFGIKKMTRPWGAVYDSVTKQPLDPVYLTLVDKDQNEIATALTDLDGRYGFLVKPGWYMLRPKKTDYIFPSTLLGHLTRDEVYLDLYFGNYFEIKEEGEVITKNIPMDPMNFNWNEVAKQDQNLLRFYSKRDLWYVRVAEWFFRIGFVIALLALIFAPKPYNIAIFALYIILLILKETGVKLSKLGHVTDKNTGAPLPFAIVRAFSSELGNEVIHKVTTEKGLFYCLVPNSSYYITIEKKNPDGTYSQIFKSEKIVVTKGVLQGKWAV